LAQTVTMVLNSEQSNYKIKLPVFEGPLELLLHLIKKNKIDIYDIPIAEITRQYIEYLEMMKELNLEIAGEFLVMAATLIQIKTRMLLPVDENIPEDEREDPRWELVERLLEYQAIKIASKELQERRTNWENVFWREPEEIETDGPQSISLFEVNIYDLYEAFKRVLEKAPVEIKEITKETITVRMRMNQILQMLKKKQMVRFDELFNKYNRRFLIITFVALLELAKLRLIKIFQNEQFGPIWIRAVSDIEGPLHIPED